MYWLGIENLRLAYLSMPTIHWFGIPTSEVDDSCGSFGSYILYRMRRLCFDYDI